jgi:uncharacterized membrane protein YdbT with pleckstrin-like domain
MYNPFRQFCERLLRIPPEPEAPPGDHAKTQIFRASPNFYKYLVVMWAVKTVAPLLFLGMFSFVPFLALVHGNRGVFTVLLIIEGIIFLLVVVSRIFSFALVRLDFEKRWYVVTDRSLRVREGLVLVREATVTYANIQNISISQGPIQRILKIADLRVDTAGGGGGSRHEQGSYNLHTVWFRGVDNGNAIKELMQQRLRQLKDSGLGDHEELVAQRVESSNGSLVSALREVHAEAAALRLAAARG